MPDLYSSSEREPSLLASALLNIFSRICAIWAADGMPPKPVLEMELPIFRSCAFADRHNAERADRGISRAMPRNVVLRCGAFVGLRGRAAMFRYV
jgi:hypothetical protein